MSRKPAISLMVILVAFIAWAALFGSHSFSISVNGRPVTGPLNGAIGAAGMLAALIAGFCAAIVLLFVFAGVGVILLGCAVLVGMVLVLVEFPFLSPLLIPLGILWLFVAIARRPGRSG